ncbi:hypothetical protein Tco_1062036 [Tanacetum coccineum]
MEAQYGKFLDIIRVVRINVPLVDVLAGMPNYGKFLKDLISNKNKIEQISATFLSDESSTMIQNKVPPKLGDPGSFLIPCNFNKALSCNALADLVIRVKQKQLTLRVGTERMIFNIDSAIKHFYSNDDTCFSIDVIDEILEEDFDALLDEGTMATNENSRNETEEEPEFEKIIINTDYKIKMSLEEPPTDLELKPLPDNLENKRISVLKKHKQAFAWKTTYIPGICPSFCKHKIQLLDDKKPVIQKQRRLNPNMQEVVKKNCETLGYQYYLSNCR